MSLSPTLAYMRMETRAFLREPAALFFTLAFPILLLIIFGGIWGNTPVERYGNLGYISLSLPGFIGMIVATSGLLTLSATTASYREIGFFRLLRTTPLTPLAVLTGQVATLFLVTLLGAALLALVGVAVWDAPLPVRPVACLIAFCESCLAFYAFGFLLAVLTPSVRSAQIISMSLFFPMLFLSGAAFPSVLLPPGIRSIAHYLPLTSTVDLLSLAWHGGATGSLLRDAGALGIFAALSLALILRNYRGEDHNSIPRAERFIGPLVALGVWVAAVTSLYG